ncbi:MAG: HAMP domain-containing sensor histidine kinase, partial [bacterium]|nr:HAMP domain-containing sensor histidine kinase [bacterium]
RITLAPARKSLSAQKQFIGNIAHELRTPLSIIKTNIEVSLLKNTLEDDYVKKMLRSNVEELDRISDIINNLLSFSTLVKPENVKFEKVNLGKVADNIVGKLGNLAKSKNILLTVEKSGSTVINSRISILEQIVMNLLKNALHYTPVGGAVLVRVRQSDLNFIELQVEDTGIGIAPKDLHRIFEPFYRADPSRVHTHSGSGLGLAIVNELVRLHNGKIFITSNLNQGTCVIISFPTPPTKGGVLKT